MTTLSLFFMVIVGVSSLIYVFSLGTLLKRKRYDSHNYKARGIRGVVRK